MVSVITTPDIRLATPVPITVTMGSDAFFSTCPRTRRVERPLARAVRM